ncbi:MAG: HAD family phosphatase, partial [Rikenellaceae bacterium]
MKKAVIFDMDGVLVDNSNIHLESFIIFCKKHQIEMSAEILAPYFGMGNEEIIPGVFGREMSEEEINALAEEKEEIYREIFSERIKPVDGLVQRLKELKEKGIKIAVGSSGMEKNVNFVLDKCNIRPYFDAIANGDMVSNAKPDPEVFLLSAKLLGVDPKDCVVFEDSFAGVKAARSAGMKVIALTTTYARELHKDFDYIIDDFTQIDLK